MAVAAAVAGAFGFVVFLAAKAPEVETARIARPTGIIFFMISSPFTWKKDAPAVQHKAHISASWSACLRHDTFPLRLPRLRSVSSQLISAIPLLAIRPVDLSFPFDTSWLFEPTTGVHSFGGGSACSASGSAGVGAITSPPPTPAEQSRSRSPNHLGAVSSKGGWGFERRMSLADACGPTIRDRTRPAHCSAGYLFGCLHQPGAATMPLAFAPAIRRPQE